MRRFLLVFVVCGVVLRRRVGAVVVALGRDPVDLNARAARGAAFDELEFDPCISTEASRFVCVMSFTSLV